MKIEPIHQKDLERLRKLTSPEKLKVEIYTGELSELLTGYMSAMTELALSLDLSKDKHIITKYTASWEDTAENTMKSLLNNHIRSFDTIEKMRDSLFKGKHPSDDLNAYRITVTLEKIGTIGESKNILKELL